jgi:hypothetical protein
LGKKESFWLEPLRNFIKIADSAGKIGFSSENSEIKSILEKSGSNRTLKDKKISMDLLAPFSDGISHLWHPFPFLIFQDASNTFRSISPVFLSSFEQRQIFYSFPSSVVV